MSDRYRTAAIFTHKQMQKQHEKRMSEFGDFIVLSRFIERGCSNGSPVEKALYEKATYEMEHPEEIQIQMKGCPVEGCDAQIGHDRMMCMSHWDEVSQDRKSALFAQIDLSAFPGARPDDLDVFEQMVRIAAKTVR